MFKFNGEIVRKAHKETKKMKKEFPEITYQFQFGLEMKYLLSNIKEVENIMVELKGSKKQVAWAEKIRKSFKAEYEEFFTRRGKLNERQETLRKQAEELLNRINNIDSAKWFIEHRKGNIPLQGGFMNLARRVWKGENMNDILAEDEVALWEYSKKH